MSTANVLIPEYSALVMPKIPTPCQTCKWCYIGASSDIYEDTTPIGIRYGRGDLGIVEGCTYDFGDEIVPFDELDEILSGDICAVKEAGEPHIYLPRWIQRREAERERGEKT